MKARIAFGVIVILLGFVMPWWFAFLLFALGAYIYAPWFELVAIAIFYDIVFSVSRLSFHGLEIVYTLYALIVLSLMYVIKKRVINV